MLRTCPSGGGRLIQQLEAQRAALDAAIASLQQVVEALTAALVQIQVRTSIETVSSVVDDLLNPPAAPAPPGAAPALPTLPGFVGVTEASAAFIAAEGGDYSRLDPDGMTRHHIPSASSYNSDPCGRRPRHGPAIRLPLEEHELTASHPASSRSGSAAAYRADEAKAMAEGRPWDAFRMGIDDLQRVLGHARDNAILEMMEYAVEFFGLGGCGGPPMAGT